MSALPTPGSGDGGLAPVYPRATPPTYGRPFILTLAGASGSLGASELTRMLWPDHMVGVIGEHATPWAVLSVLAVAGWIGVRELRYVLNLAFPRVQVNYYDLRGNGDSANPAPSNPHDGEPTSGNSQG